MNPIERIRLAARLTAKLEDLVAASLGGSHAQAMTRIRISAEVNALALQLGGDAPASPGLTPAEQVLRDIAAGKRDTKPLPDLYGQMQEAVGALVEIGALVGDAEKVAHDAVTRWAELEEEAHG